MAFSFFKKKFGKGFEKVESELGIPALLDPEDMVSMKVPHRLSIITYISQYYNVLTNKSVEVNPPCSERSDGTVQAKLGTKRPEAHVSDLVLESKKDTRDQSKRDTLSNTCAVCQKQVHLVQRHLVNEKLYHRSCFRCQECSSYKAGSEAGTLICNHHFSNHSNCPDLSRPGEPMMTLGGKAIKSETLSAAKSQEKTLPQGVVPVEPLISSEFAGEAELPEKNGQRNGSREEENEEREANKSTEMDDGRRNAPRTRPSKVTDSTKANVLAVPVEPINAEILPGWIWWSRAHGDDCPLPPQPPSPATAQYPASGAVAPGWPSLPTPLRLRIWMKSLYRNSPSVPIFPSIPNALSKPGASTSVLPHSLCKRACMEKPPPSYTPKPKAPGGPHPTQPSVSIHGFPNIKKKKMHSAHLVRVEDIQVEMRELERHLNLLELRGVELERNLRGCQSGEQEETLLVDWFTLIHQKHVMVRREAMLVYTEKQQNLEKRQANVEYDLRCLLNKPETEWINDDWIREQQLMAELVKIIEERDHIVNRMDQDKQRHVAEDKLLAAMIERR
ncbi:MICAL-like protein 1 [Anguilla anguilla]|uniref:MICAL-like protein 1 n=1 Tax=Anguilla anguilla TaxID=7936 RepID=UPI0015AD2F34|nr:MICAL-like protein 1 [Anguilla anguilla]